MSRRRALAKVAAEVGIAARIAAAAPGGVPAFAAERTSGGTLRMICPACGTVNLHGAPGGHRAGHCGCWPRGYLLTEAAHV